MNIEEKNEVLKVIDDHAKPLIEFALSKISEREGRLACERLQEAVFWMQLGVNIHHKDQG